MARARQRWGPECTLVCCRVRLCGMYTVLRWRHFTNSAGQCRIRHGVWGPRRRPIYLYLSGELPVAGYAGEVGSPVPGGPYHQTRRLLQVGGGSGTALGSALSRGRCSGRGQLQAGLAPAPVEWGKGIVKFCYILSLPFVWHLFCGLGLSPG